MKSGRTLWDELALRYQQGVDEVRGMQRDWATLRGKIDDGFDDKLITTVRGVGYTIKD